RPLKSILVPPRVFRSFFFAGSLMGVSPFWGCRGFCFCYHHYIGVGKGFSDRSWSVILIIKKTTRRWLLIICLMIVDRRSVNSEDYAIDCSLAILGSLTAASGSRSGFSSPSSPSHFAMATEARPFPTTLVAERPISKN